MQHPEADLVYGADRFAIEGGGSQLSTAVLVLTPPVVPNVPCKAERRSGESCVSVLIHVKKNAAKEDSNLRPPGPEL